LNWAAITLKKKPTERRLNPGNSLILRVTGISQTRRTSQRHEKQRVSLDQGGIVSLQTLVRNDINARFGT
jgi:hypothetical protein